MKFEFDITKVPAKTGAVQYSCFYEGCDVINGKPVPWVIYIPQQLCNRNGGFKEHIILEMPDED